jgi:nudix-type nucleoside diphosphatase (YffH/AdpP family)
MSKVKRQEIVFKDRIIVEKGYFGEGEKEFNRLRINREDASVILVVNTETKNVILTKQYRYAASSKSDGMILEIVAGKIDKEGEDPNETALREIEEEVGYKAKPENLHFLFSCFTSPGYTSERFNYFYATVTNDDKISEGGGLKDENEDIEVVEVGIEEFKRMIEKGGLDDAKTVTAGLYAVNKGFI